MRVAKENNSVKSQNPEKGSVTFLLSRASKNLSKKARRKAVSKSLAQGLLRVSQNEVMTKSYKRTYEVCNERMFQTNGQMHTAYCSNRFCLVCGNYRQMRMWLSYGRQISEWKNQCYMVTLTIPNVKGIELRSTLQLMHKRFRYCWHHMRHKEGLEVRLVRATEVTYSKKNNTYHPHLHCLVKGKKTAVRLMKNWLQRWPEAKSVAQDIRKADKKAVYEVFKYCAKLGTDTRDADGFLQVVPMRNLNTIYTAVRGLRLWSVAGLRSELGQDVSEEGELQIDQTTPAVKRVDEELLWEWSEVMTDWIDYTTGDTLADYTPSDKVKRFMKNIEESC